MSMEVITTEDKEKRDALFDELRKTGNRLEKQVVKFSGCRNIAKPGDPPQYVSTYSVAYPCA